MKSLIAYASRYGTTAECARLLAAHLPDNVELLDIADRSARRTELRGYDTVVIGGPIYGGKMLSAVGRFCERRREELLSTSVGLFICCLYTGERAQAELEAAFPAWLLAHAGVSRVFGGAVTLARLNPFDRYLVRRVGRVDGDIRRIDEAAIVHFAEAVGSADDVEDQQTEDQR